MADLNSFFNPSGIMVVGASSTPGKLGAVMAESLAAYGAEVHLVNARGGTGMHTSIADAVGAATSGIDLAVLCVPAAATAQALRDCAKHGVQAALVCAGGFAEAGEAGQAFDQEIRSAIADTGIRMLGPNTSGFFVPGRSLLASFVPGVAALASGPVAVVAASGGMNHVLAFGLQRAGVGVSLGIGIGAGVDLNAAEVLDYLVDDESTRAVVLHLETVPDGPLLLEAVRRLSARKPVIVLVVGRNDVSEFAESHTGALASSWNTTRAVLAQAGAVVVDDETQLIDAAIALSGRRAAPAPTVSAGLVTGQAGPGLLMADRLLNDVVQLPRLHQDTLAKIAEVLPPITYQANPVDTGRPGTGYDTILRAVAQDPSIDVVGVYGITEPVISLPDSIAASGIAARLPVLVGVDGPDVEVRQARIRAAEAGVPLLTGPTALARGLEALGADARAQYLALDDDSPRAVAPTIDASGPWDENRSKDFLVSLGIATPARRACDTRDEARRALAELGGPVAVKILDATILHKTEIGGVHLGIGTAEELESALAALEQTGASAILVEKMADKGVDLVLGVRRDPVFGPIALLGVGGVATEVYADSAIRSLPVTRRSALEMPRELAAAELLQGFRSGPTVDEEALVEHIRSLGAALEANPDIIEIEVNPLRVTESGLLALDAVVITKEN